MIAPAPLDLERLRRSLHPLHSPPAGPAWNLPELDDVLPAAQPRVNAAVLLPLVQRAADLHVLLTRRTEGLTHHAGQISFPGGRIEAADADPVAAALREAEEEVGLQPDWLEAIGYLDPYDTISGFRIMPVVARLHAGYRAVPEPGEVAEAFEAPLSFLLDPANCQRRSAEYRGRVRHFYEVRFQGHRIWGATTAMLMNLRSRLEGVGE